MTRMPRERKLPRRVWRAARLAALAGAVAAAAASAQEGFVPEVGEQLTLYDTSSGQTIQVPVLNVSEAGITVDTNHRLAGDDLNFEITLVEIL